MRQALQETEWKTVLGFRAFGRTFEFRSDAVVDIDDLASLLPPNAETGEGLRGRDVFTLIADRESPDRGLYWNDELLNPIEDHHVANPEVLECKIQYALSLALSSEWVFLHAGAVSVNGQGVLIPGDSKSGKTSLTHAFLKEGADYLTDDCAVLDKYGEIHPYPAALRIRKDGRGDERVVVRPGEIGAKTAEGPVPVKAIVLSNFEEGVKWQPSELGEGATMWELLRFQFYSSAVREAPETTLAILARAVKGAKSFQGKRGEASEVVNAVFRHFN